jgi:hypothetical protein
MAAWLNKVVSILPVLVDAISYVIFSFLAVVVIRVDGASYRACLAPLRIWLTGEEWDNQIFELTLPKDTNDGWNWNLHTAQVLKYHFSTWCSPLNHPPLCQTHVSAPPPCSEPLKPSQKFYKGINRQTYPGLYRQLTKFLLVLGIGYMFWDPDPVNLAVAHLSSMQNLWCHL